MSILQAAIATLFAVTKVAAGVPGMYRRGEVVQPVTVIKGDTRTEQAGIDDVTVIGRSADVLIDRVDIAEVFEKPRAGDRVEVETADGGIAVYEAMTLGGEVWRWSDPGQTRYRIHVKQVGASS